MFPIASVRPSVPPISGYPALNSSLTHHVILNVPYRDLSEIMPNRLCHLRHEHSHSVLSASPHLSTQSHLSVAENPQL